SRPTAIGGLTGGQRPPRLLKYPTPEGSDLRLVQSVLAADKPETEGALDLEGEGLDQAPGCQVLVDQRRKSQGYALSGDCGRQRHVTVAEEDARAVDRTRYAGLCKPGAPGRQPRRDQRRLVVQQECRIHRSRVRPAAGCERRT